MKRFATRVLPLALALAIVAAWPAERAQAAGANSVGIWAGYEFNNKSGDFSDWKWGIDYEYRFETKTIPEFAFGLELPFQYYSPNPKVSTDRGKFAINTTVWTLMPSVKVYWLGLGDLGFGEIHPYAGAGVGWGHVSYEDPIDDSENVLAWRVVAGGEYVPPMKELPFLVFVEYEYSSVGVDESHPVLAITGNSDLGANAVQGGLRFRF